MAQKLKSQDLMELFNEKLDKAIEKFDLSEKIVKIFNGKLNEIEKTTIKIEIEPLNKVITENSKNFEK